MRFQQEQQRNWSSNLNEYALITMNFQNNRKNIQLTWPHVTRNQRRLPELLKKIICNQDQPISKKEQNNNAEPVIFTTQYNPLISNTSSIIKRHLPVPTGNPSLMEMFPKDSIFCAYKRFPNLRDLMVCADPYIIKPLKKVDQVAVIVRKEKNYLKLGDIFQALNYPNTTRNESNIILMGHQ